MVLKYLRWITILIFIFALIFWIKSMVKNHKDDNPKEKSGSEYKKSEYIEHKWIRSDSITVSLYSDFRETYTLNYGDRFTFEGSTQPYCVINKNNYKECGEKGQDVSPKMGVDNGNIEFRFKSTSGEYGKIKLVIWREIEIKKYI